MAQYYYYFLLLFITLITTNNLCIIGSITCYSNGQKLVCLIGDVHNNCYRSDACCARTEMRDTRDILDLALCTANNANQVIFLIEESMHHLDSMNKFISTRPHLLLNEVETLANFAQQYNWRLGNTYFMFADNRGPAFCCWVDQMIKWRGYTIACAIAPYFNEIMKHQPSLKISLPEACEPIHVDRELRNNPLLLQALFSQSSGFTKAFLNKKSQMTHYGHIYTVGEFFEELSSLMNVLSENLAILDQDSTLYQFLKPYKEMLTKAINDAYNFFEESCGHDPNVRQKSIAECVYNAIVTKLFYALENENEWSNLLLRIADINFVIMLERALSQNNRVIFVGGNGHCKRLQSFMENKGFTKIYDKTWGKIKAKNGYFVSPWSDEKIKKYMMKAESLICS